MEEEITKLEELLSQGFILQNEYNLRKAALLGGKIIIIFFIISLIFYIYIFVVFIIYYLFTFILFIDYFSFINKIYNKYNILNII